ncbi:hypothetical protein E1B28_002163 [Marasmius oreades]|uniref:Uncharacterized protein n=1 Tax=Marasmius oreades TaxID=181124 RepID=A0A9P7RN48_9AGAR|nr:uncharacterized protein E1B28_002163 [Marasmius oreades]KAG7086200.1 hypothetical protein E1B28_002163 [Marasmius oreades]
MAPSQSVSKNTRPRTKTVTLKLQVAPRARAHPINRRQPRPHLSVNQRIHSLLTDPLVHKQSLGSFRISCLACGQRVQLDKRESRPFYAFNWTKHRNANCQRAIEAQKRINDGQKFEVAEVWKTWSRDWLTKDDKESDKADKAKGRGLYDPIWREQWVKLGILEGSECGDTDVVSGSSRDIQRLSLSPASDMTRRTPSGSRGSSTDFQWSDSNSSGSDSGSTSTTILPMDCNELRLARFLSTIGLHCLASVALDEEGARQQ